MSRGRCTRLSLGVTALQAEFSYGGDSLWSTFYIRTQGVGTLLIPNTIDLADGFTGALLKPHGRVAAREVLDWGEVPESERPPFLR